MLQLLCCALLAQASESAFDARDIQKTSRWAKAGVETITSASGNPAARERAAEAFRKECKGVKGQDVEWTLTLLSLREEGKRLGVFLQSRPLKVFVCSPECAADPLRQRPQFLIPADDEAAKLRPRRPVTVRGRLKSLDLGEDGAGFFCVAILTDVRISQAGKP